MKNFFISGAVAIICFNPLATIASTPVVRSFKQSQVSGNNAILQTIHVWNGHGVSISFYDLGETIKRVWIDDPSQILIDTDGCLEGLEQNCQNTGAGLIHLRRINRVNIPGLPQTSSTHLTIITENSRQERKSYHFRVVAGQGTPQYSQIAIIKEISTPARPQLQPFLDTFHTTRNIRYGLGVAVKNQWIHPSDLLHQRITNFISYLTGGDEIQSAANKAAISMKLVNKLIEIGENTAANQKISTEKNHGI